MVALNIDPRRTALLVMDFQQGVIAYQLESRRTMVLEQTRAALDAARHAGVLVVYVAVRLRPGYPDVSPRNPRFSGIKEAGRMAEGNPEAEIHPAVSPLPGEPVVLKRRVGAFSYTDLEVILHSHDITTLVLCGFSTAGVVLSTVRAGSDMDYDLIVLEDCCGDPNAQVHEVLMATLFPTQAVVASAQDFITSVS